MIPTEVNEKVRKAAILNAVRHHGKADPKAVLSNLLGDEPELKPKARELIPLVRQVVEEVNSLPESSVTKIASEKWPQEIVRERAEEERKLPPLPNVEAYPLIVTRIAPNPDLVLHIGNARAAILSHDYARMYKGKFIVRFEDTDPRLKKAQLEYYDKIRDDLRWLGCEWDEEFIQSDRLQLYYEVGETLVRKRAAYVCQCKPEKFRGFINACLPCPDRELDDAHTERWVTMLNGGYKEGEAVLRIKTDVSHPNPAIRDWPAFRVIDTERNPHPRVGSRFVVWPLYNLASGVDDHSLGITHIIRGKEHLTNMERQVYLYNYMGWKYPEAIHYGRLKIEGMDLSKSRIMKALDSGQYAGVDDPRLGTLVALRRRGFSPETIRKLIWEVGPKPVDVTISWDNFNAENRKLIDPIAHRYYFVSDPIRTDVTDVKRQYEVHPPLHPQHLEMGTRTLTLQPNNAVVSLLLSRSDVSLLKSHPRIRLIGLFDFQRTEMSNQRVLAKLSEDDGAEGMPILQWVPLEENLPVEVVMPDATIKKGLAEGGLKSESVGSMIQFVRFGFGKIDALSSERAIVYYAHQ